MTKKDQVDALFGAVYRQEFGQISELLKQGTDINIVDGDGRTALVHAILADKPSSEMIVYLVSLGANVNLSDKGRRWSPLHFSARDQSVPISEILLKNGAVVDAKDSNGNTPLWRAIMSATPDIDLLQLLLRSGADPTLQNNSGVSPLLLAERMSVNQVESKTILGLLSKPTGQYF